MNEELLDAANQAYARGEYKLFVKLYTAYAESGQLPVYDSPHSGKCVLLLGYEWLTSIGHICYLDPLVKAYRLRLLPTKIEGIEVHGYLPDIGNVGSLSIFPEEVTIYVHGNREKYLQALKNISKDVSTLPLSLTLLGNNRFYDSHALHAGIEELVQQQGIDIEYQNFAHVRSRYNQFLERYDGFITLHVRHGPTYGGRRAGRNCAVENFIEAVDHIAENFNCCTIRLGDRLMPKVDHPHVLDLAHTESREHIDDVYFLANTSLHIGTQSGPLFMPLIYKRPVLLAGSASIGLMSFLAYRDFEIIPKRWFNKSEKRFLSFEEWMSNKILTFSELAVYQDNILLDCKPVEITRSADTILKRLTNQKSSTKIDNISLAQARWKAGMTCMGYFSSAVPPNWFCELYLQ